MNHSKNHSKKIGLAIVLSLSFAACSSTPKDFGGSVDKTIGSHHSDFQNCYDLAVKQRGPDDPNPATRVDVGLTVSPAGAVTEANIINTTGSYRLDKCVQETLRRIQFPSNSDGRLIQTTYPIEFKTNS